MKLKEIIIIFSSILCLFFFIHFMFQNHIKNQEIQIVKKKIYYDSLLLSEQQELRKQDSIIFAQQELIKKLINNQGGWIYSINKKIKNIEKNGNEQ